MDVVCRECAAPMEIPDPRRLYCSGACRQRHFQRLKADRDARFRERAFELLMEHTRLISAANPDPAAIADLVRRTERFYAAESAA